MLVLLCYGCFRASSECNAFPLLRLPLHQQVLGAGVVPYLVPAVGITQVRRFAHCPLFCCVCASSCVLRTAVVASACHHLAF